MMAIIASFNRLGKNDVNYVHADPPECVRPPAVVTGYRHRRK